MLLAEMKSYPGSKRQKKRRGRGKGSGRGGTSTRGHKGQKARKSGNLPAGFEGGTMPLARRLPKFGWTNAPFKTVYQVINLSRLKDISDKKEIGPAFLVKNGLAKKNVKIKILASVSGTWKKPLVIRAHKFSRQAKLLLEKSGGKALTL